MIRIISPLVVFLWALCLCVPAGGRGGSAVGDEVKPLELKQSEKREIALNQDRLLITQPDGKRKAIRVALQETVYDARVLRVREGKTKEWSGTLSCYELRSTDTDAPYAWALWSLHPLGLFRLFSNERGENYLAWVRGTDIQFAEVSKPKDRSLALAEAFSRKLPPGIVYVPVRDLVPEARSWGVNAFYSDITILSVAKDEAGNWIVKISDPSGKKVFTLVSEGDKRENWRKK